MEAAPFSIDRPFGVHLYKYFDKLYTAIVGEPASKFSFVPGETPLSTTHEVILGCITYLLLIFGGQWLLKDARPINPKAIFRAHNLLLTAVSGLLLALLIEQIVPQLFRHGLNYTVCSPYGWTQKHELLYYLNYLVKWWELADTAFLVLKKKKLEFLHYFHHSMTMVLCYTQLVGQTTVSWVPIMLNLTVHVVMYYYYFRTASGYRIWWKKYLTTLQIVQFLIDLCAIYSCTYSFYVNKLGLDLPNFGPCAGSEEAAWFGCALLTSYLLLFINFYRMTYKQQGPSVASAITDGTTPAAYRGQLAPTPPPKTVSAAATTTTTPPRVQPARRSKKI